MVEVLQPGPMLAHVADEVVTVKKQIALCLCFCDVVMSSGWCCDVNVN